MDLREVVAANLRRLRHVKGLWQDDLAYEADVSRSYLSQLEKGAFYASLKVVAKLATVLEVEPAEHPRIGAQAQRSTALPGIPHPFEINVTKADIACPAFRRKVMLVNLLEIGTV
jgi:transcriptional regulator with XRE-family HTH domain